MSILVSIACITYNHESYIADALDSFLMQKTKFDYEILIGEDCSTDGTKRIVEYYLERYPDKIRLITSDKNVGMQRNFQRLQENAIGKYIALCEGDDYWLDPHKLQKQLDYMENNPDCTMCFHGAQIVKSDKKPTGKFVRPFTGNVKCTAGDIALTQFPTASIVYPKSLMDNPPQWVIEALAGDYPLALITTSHGYAYYINEVMSAYRTAVKGSATTRLYTSETMKIVNFHQSVVNVLENFDRYSDYKYSNQVDKAKIIREIEILLLERNFSKIRDERYKDNFKEIGTMGRLKFYARYLMPTTYTKMAIIKDYFYDLI